MIMIGTNLNKNLMKVSDQEWLGLIELLTEVLHQISYRKVVSIEGTRVPDEYPEFVFRITTEPNRDMLDSGEREATGLVVGVSLEDYDDVFLEPMTDKSYRKEWLEENGITHTFLTYHVGSKHIYDYLSRKLKLWEEVATEKPDNDFPTDSWRTLSIA